MTTLPRIVEPHHHYVMTSEAFHSPLKVAGVPEYTPTKFVEDCAGLTITKAVHVECAPVDPLGEAQGIEAVITSKQTSCVGIVAACNLAAPDAADQLKTLKERCAHVVGIRYVVDFAGPFGEAPATHVFVSRHGEGGKLDALGSGKGVDFLRDPAYATAFEAGFAALGEVGLTFDLQCAPEQLVAAAEMIGRHPSVRVVIDHLGKPRLGNDDAAMDESELATWRAGMTKMAALPNVFVKLSMLGYIVPGWVADPSKEAQISALVLETVDRFGADRCMFSTNWWSAGAMANSDGRDSVAVSMKEMWSRYHAWVKDRYSAEHVERLFAGTAEEFYRI